MNSKRLRDEMKKQGMTQYRLSKITGISSSSVCFAFNGTKKNQPSKTIIAFEKALGLKKGELL